MSDVRLVVMPEPKIVFRTLLTFGRAVTGVGWLSVAVGASVALASAAVLLGFWSAPSPTLAAYPLFGLLGGAVVGLMGLGMVVLGQLVSCFVAIEKNTRVAYEMLKLNLEA